MLCIRFHLNVEIQTTHVKKCLEKTVTGEERGPKESDFRFFLQLPHNGSIVGSLCIPLEVLGQVPK